jgi:hypothetical protein
MLAVNRKKATDKSSGNTFFDAKRVAAPRFIAILLKRETPARACWHGALSVDRAEVWTRVWIWIASKLSTGELP